jgi:ammonium transporter, Amt family
MEALMTAAYGRIRTNMRDPVRRKNVALLMTGKAIGLAIVFGLMLWAVPQVAHAQDGTTETDPIATINAVNTAWTLIAAFLVFCMQVGFVMLESGFARERESVNILVEGIADTCICGILFWAIGFAFMFEDGNKFIGTHGFFLQGLDETYGSTGVPLLAFWLFQFAFADTASTITSGAMVGRCGFIGDLLYSVGVTGFIYPIVGHWAWGPDGWLAMKGFHDFAGSTVVHTIGGTLSLCGAIALGPRLGRVFRRDGGGPPPPHNVIMGAVGGLILWFGWYGFNPGSTLSALDAAGIGRVSFNTTMAACSAGLVALFFSYARTRKWDLGYTTNGFLAGLVAITCPCYWVTPTGAFFIGIIGASAMIIGLEVLEWFRVDDPIGAVPVHMFAGLAGTMSLGLFGAGAYGLPTSTGADTSAVVTGLFYGGAGHTLLVQTYGTFAVCGATLLAGLALMYGVKLTRTLRVSEAGEREGLDLHEHGVSAYPEFVVNRGFSSFAPDIAGPTGQTAVAQQFRSVEEGGTA